MIELRYFQFMVDSKLINKHLKSGTVYSLPFRGTHDFIGEIVRAYTLVYTTSMTHINSTILT